MCGFAGYILSNSEAAEAWANRLPGLGEQLIHRGPDEQGAHTGKNFGVIHRRLSIVDIAHGQQPMVTEDGQVGIAYNGEVYNYLPLREDLEARGHRFYTESDTEVVLRLFVEYGPDAFRRLDGMFSAFLWDLRASSDGEFYLVRDPMGIKPLYVYRDDDKTVFSSELKPLLATEGLDLELDPVGIHSFLTFRYCHAPSTFFRRIERVEAGSYWRMSDGCVLRARYHYLEPERHPVRMSLDEAGRTLHELLLESVRNQQMGEVPVGLLLSGGVDSSAIACLLGELGTPMMAFNIGFPQLNEFPFSREVANAFQLNHTEVTTTPEQIAGRFGRVVAAMDEPIADAACFPLHILSEEISNHVTVLLSGEGSDELFAGYPQYAAVIEAEQAPAEQQFHHFLQRSWYFVDSAPPLKVKIDPARIWRHRADFYRSPPLSGMLDFDLKTWIPENLMMKADKILMSHSLEGRFPFLSRSVIEFARSLPEEFKYADGIGKRVLKHAFRDKLPAKILDRQKMGFSVPVKTILAQLESRTRDLSKAFSDHPLADVLDFQIVHQIVDDHFSNGQQSAARVWNLLVLMEWFEQARSWARSPIIYRDAPPQMVRVRSSTAKYLRQPVSAA